MPRYTAKIEYVIDTDELGIANEVNAIKQEYYDNLNDLYQSGAVLENIEVTLF
jgi:hypothetical protein